jgi:phosphoglycerate dehydrogenase-like enzyme
MGFKLVICPPDVEEHLADRLKEAIPDIDVQLCATVGEAMEVIGDADAAYGDIVPELFKRAQNLKWIACSRAGPPAGYYHQALIDSDVVVTNARGTLHDHIGVHVMAFVLAFARGFQVYIPQQLERTWRRSYDTVHLPDATATIVGLGAIGEQVARRCYSFGMNIIGVDPRRVERLPEVSELHGPEALPQVLPRSDFVIVTVPQTPETQGMFAAAQFRQMKSTAFFINVGRGATVVLDDLAAALRSGEIAGAGLDVFQVEPLPSDHSLWTAPGVLLTPHMAGNGPNLPQRRDDLFIENCQRFNEGRALRNVVDKASWF